MAKLILSFEGTVLKTVPLTKERTTLGRRPDNDIQVDNLAVSGVHAIVTTIANDCVLEDQNSTNGTMVNGQPVHKHLLQHNDVIELGKHKLRFVAEAVVAQPYQNFEKTMVMRRPVAQTAPDTAAAHAATQTNMPPLTAPAAPQPAMSTMSPMAAAAPPQAVTPPPVRPAAIEVQSGKASGRTLELTKNITTLGQAGVGAAMITRRPNGYFITHVEGATFPLVNGISIGAQAQQLDDQDTFEIASIKMRFFYLP